MLPFLYQPKESAVTFANPGDGASFLTKLADIGPLLPTEKDTAIDTALAVINRPDAYRDLFGAAAKQTEFVDNAFARDLSREEAYDRRIKAVKDTTGITLENPERWGYQQDAKRAVRNDLMASGGQGVDETGGIPAYRRRIFDQKLAELRSAHPDKSADLTFGNIDEEGRAIAKGAEDEYTRARSQPDLDPAASIVTEFAGSMWGMRRDPLMVGSLFFGPTTAAGKAVVARIASAGLRQGLYNAGLSAIEQPAVQAWRDEVGLKSGVTPAIENVGLAFVFGAIPGAALRGIHEAGRAPIKRVLEGRAEPGDVETAIKAVGGEVSPQEAGAIKLGEEMDAASRVTRPAKPKDVTPELHDNLTTAAQRYADDPVNQPSPAAVGFIEVYHGSPHDFDAFSLSRIGTGEGAQSYGHGLYFAERPEVAKSYAEMGQKFLVNGQPYNVENPLHRASALMEEFNGKREFAIKEAQRMFDHDPDPYNTTLLDTLKDRGKPIPKMEQVVKCYQYTVLIHADREHFLDWDKPLSEQTPKVQAALKRLGVFEPEAPHPAVDYEGLMAHGPMTGAGVWDQVLHDIVEEMGGSKNRPAVETASQILREAGIPGIKYLDQGSRIPVRQAQDEIGRWQAQLPKAQADLDAAMRQGASPRTVAELQGEVKRVQDGIERVQGQTQGTSNFVLFDDKLVEITHKNDSPVAREVADRVAAANPQTQHEAQMAASEALEDIGNREARARTRIDLERYTLEETFDLGAKPAPASSKDPLDKIPMARDDGTPTLVSARQAARAGERETQFVELIRECK